MSVVLNITLPIFVVILAGYLAAWRGFIEAPGVRGLTSFVYYFALPLMLFHIFANAPITQQFNGPYVVAFAVVAVIIHLGGLAVARWIFKSGWSEQAIQGVAVSFGNTMFIALPIAIGLFGDAGALPVLLAVIVENGIIMPFTIVLLEIGRAGPGAGGRAVAQAIVAGGRAVVMSPIIVPVFLGAAVAGAGLQVPDPVNSFIAFVRGATVPAALFALGATLYGRSLTERARETVFVIAAKLFVYPAAVFVALTIWLPDLDPMWRAGAVLAAAVPTGNNVFLVASQYNVFIQRASTAVFATTVVSVVTISVLVLVFS